MGERSACRRGGGLTPLLPFRFTRSVSEYDPPKRLPFLRTAEGVTFLFGSAAVVAFLLNVATEGIALHPDDDDLVDWSLAFTTALGVLAFYYLPRKDHEGSWTFNDLKFMIFATLGLGITLPEAINRLIDRKPAEIWELPVTDVYFVTHKNRRLLGPDRRVQYVETLSPVAPHQWLQFPASGPRPDRGQCLRAVVRHGLLGPSWIVRTAPIACAPRRGLAPPAGHLTIRWYDGFDTWEWTSPAIVPGERFREWQDRLIGELLMQPPAISSLLFRPILTMANDGSITDATLWTATDRPDLDAIVINSLKGQRNLITPESLRDRQRNGQLMFPTIAWEKHTIRIDRSQLASNWSD